MFEAFFKDKLGPLALRLALGGVCAYHGFLKIMAHGGAAWASHMPEGLQLLIAWGEFTAGLAILLGFHCRIAATTALLVTGGTLAWWHGWNLFHLPLKTLEPSLLLILMGLSLVFQGGGELSLDGRGSGSSGGASGGKAPKRKAA
jgi:uncharacterized membrane protein YphA (DoxX/SURF4 family)